MKPSGGMYILAARAAAAKALGGQLLGETLSFPLFEPNIKLTDELDVVVVVLLLRVVVVVVSPDDESAIPIISANILISAFTSSGEQGGLPLDLPLLLPELFPEIFDDDELRCEKY